MLVLQIFLRATFENTFRTNPTKTHAQLIIQKIAIEIANSKIPKTEKIVYARHINPRFEKYRKHECDRANASFKFLYS